MEVTFPIHHLEASYVKIWAKVHPNQGKQDLGIALVVTDFSTLHLCLVIIVSLKILVKFGTG